LSFWYQLIQAVLTYWPLNEDEDIDDDDDDDEVKLIVFI